MQSVALTNYLAANLETSAWYNVLRSYYGVVNGAKVYVSGQLTFAGSYNLFPTWRKKITNTTDIKKAVVSNIFDAGVLEPDPNTIYAVIFRGDFSVSTSSSAAWLQDWCGFRTGVFLESGHFYPMFVVGDLSSVDPEFQFYCGADSPYPNGNLAADSLANAYAHEVIEVITNPLLSLSPGWTFNPGPDRYTSQWGIGDECAWLFPSGYSQVGAKNYTLQKIWQPGEVA